MRTEFDERTSEANALFDNFIQCAEKKKPRCPLFGSCGGCAFQDVSLKDQAEAKKAFLEYLFPSLFKRFHHAPSKYFYRNRMDFVCAFGDVGLRKKNSFNLVVGIEQCLLMSEQSNEVLQAIKRKLKQHAITDYDFLNHEGFLRYIVLREAKNNKSFLINFITSADETKNKTENDKLTKLANELREEFPFSSIAFCANEAKSDVSKGRVYRVFGNDFYEEKLCGKNFRIPANAFFQTNVLQAEKLFTRIHSLIPQGSRVLDVFCGVGTIGIILSGKAREVVGIELEKEMFEAAQQNAQINNASNAHFLAGDARIVLKQLIAEGRQFDSVILDPPRAGLTKKIISRATTLASDSIYYSSCNPITQARDFEWFEENNFIPEWVEAWDFFPNTKHVETLALLKKR